ncbi:MAG: type II toxin-antitoxin system PemK/MazF family toxin [Faecalimonas sp.]|nr:type II toxin-antitoxin system PemK/MazF family toxin [Faecalimonas sp.]
MDLKKSYIYKYQDGNQTPLCIYLCNTQASQNILVVPLIPVQSAASYKLSVTKQFADIASYKEIKREDIIAPLFLNSTHVKVPDADINYIWNCIISDLFSKTESDAVTPATPFHIFEYLYSFLKWKRQKLNFNISPYKKNTTVYENAVYWANLGVNVGSELNKNRPVLIWKKRCSDKNEANHSFIVIPITSKQKSRKYYMNVPIDINGKVCYLRIEDMRRINIRRISRPILDAGKDLIFIDQKKRTEILNAIQSFYIFNNQHSKS